MEPPPHPSSSGRFRLRVQIYPPQEAYNLNAAPLRQFTIVKTPVLALPDLTLQELCDEVVKRFRVIYPGESLFAIEKPQDSYGSDLYLGDRVRDVFEDNEVFRVIKGATIRASVEPHRARSQSVQSNGVFQYGSTRVSKRSYGHSETEDLLRAQKRQRIVTNDPDRPLRSRERDTVEREVQVSGEQAREATVIQDSQRSTTEDRAGRGVNELSPVVTKYGRINSNQARRDDSVDQRHSNLIVTSSASHQRIPIPPSLASSKDEAATSDSDAYLPRSRAMSRSKRKLNFMDDSSEQDRGHSISTAVTTPQSVLQQPQTQSSIIDNRKLRRPTARTGRNNAAEEQIIQKFPRQNVYEVIETDTERPSVKPVSHDVLSKISNSNKWKAYKSSTTSSIGKSSPHQRNNVVIKKSDVQVPEEQRLNEGDQQQTLVQEQNRVAKLAKQRAEQERSKLAFEATEKWRLDAERKEKDREVKLTNERIVAEKVRREIEAKKAQEMEEAEAEAAAMRRREALAKAEAAKAAQLAEKARAEKARVETEANTKLEEQRKARLDEEVRAREAFEAEKLQFELEALRKAEQENDLKEQAILQSRQENKQKSQSLKASLEATVRRAASTPAKVFGTEAMPQANQTGPASSAGPAATSNKRVTCTPFIPRGRPSEFSPASLRPSQVIAGSLPKVPSPNVGLEDQMPMPPQLKRKVSFVDQAPPSARRSSSASSSLKQTTLVPPRLGITDVKSTPKRTPLKANITGSKLPKGKAKVMESPGKPPTPTIEISSDEESTTNSNEPVLQHNNFKGVGSPGPAYQKSAARQVLSPPKSQSFIDVIELDGKAENRHIINAQRDGKSGRENSNSPRRSSTNPVSLAPPNNKSNSTPDPSASHGCSSSSPIAIPPNTKTPQSQNGSSTQSHNSSKVAKTPQPAGSKQAKMDHLEIEKRSVPIDDDSEDELDSIDTPDALEPADIAVSLSSGYDDATHLKDDQSETSDDEIEEKSESDEPRGAPQRSTLQELVKNQQDDSTNLRTDMEDENTDDEIDEESDDKDADTQGESTDEELVNYSDAMQAQVDDQLLTQSFESSSSFQQASNIPNTGKVQLTATKDIGLLQNHGPGRPSLRRMNLEAQRAKEANLQAAKARGLEKAQKLLGGTKPSGLLGESSEEASSSELNSTSPEDETDDDEPVANTRSKKSRTSNAEENHGDLNNDDVEEMSQQLLAKSGSRKTPTSTRESALKSPSRGPDLMFRPTSKLQQNADKNDGKKSTKIGWAKLGKQFSANKHKSSV